MDDIQSWWEVPSIAHFCSLFRAAFNLLDFDIEELEEALLTDGAEDSGSSLLQELIVRLLCGCLGNNDISTFNYQMFLRRLFRQKCQEYGRDNPFNTDMDFQFLPLRTKVEILHALCDFRLDADDVQDLLKNLESDSLRVEPLGHDENNSAYWYFYGTRLYREDYPKSGPQRTSFDFFKRKTKEKRRKGKEEKKRKKHGKPDAEFEDKDKGIGASGSGGGAWQVVCFTEQDWDTITEGFRESRSKAEKELYHTLAEDFLPEIPRLFAEKERLQRKRMMEYQPRRQSSRIEKLKQQKEEEERIRQGKREKEKQQERRERSHQSRNSNKSESRSNRAQRALMRSRTNSECGSNGSVVEPRVETKTAFVGRQTNNSLSSATGQIFIQGLRRKLRSSPSFRRTDEDLQTGMYKILESIKNHEDAWPFLEAVDEEYAPGYYSVIVRPMDLQRIEDKLDEGEYMSFTDFKSDFQLIVDNCRKYNGTDNEYTEMVGNLQEAFQVAFDRYLESEPSSDEEVAVEFPENKVLEKPLTPRSTAGKNKSLAAYPEELQRIPSPLPMPPSPPSSNNVSKLPKEGKEEEEEPGDEAPDSDAGSTRDESETKCSHSDVKPSSRRKKKAALMKNAAAIEALELATEQTLKDINKWLDDTPRFSEFSSASNSPSHLASAEEYESVGSRIDSEYRRSLKLDKPPRTKESKESKRRLNKDSSKQLRRREVQRTIERLQPGKSKGNLLSNIQSSAKVSEEGSLGKPNDACSTCPRAEEATPKLSLGTVLGTDVLDFGVGQNNHNFEEKKEEMSVLVADEPPIPPLNVRPETPELQPENLKIEDKVIKKKEKAQIETESLCKESRQEKAMPNLSAWIKAFGAPKAAVLPKKRVGVFRDAESIDILLDEERRDVCNIYGLDNPTRKVNSFQSYPAVSEKHVSVLVENKSFEEPDISTGAAAPRQRKVSTGSSVSERSSFSQDLLDPGDGSSPRLSLDEQLGHYCGPYPSPLHPTPPLSSPKPEEGLKFASYPPLNPVNGTIRVGFYQDTSSSLQKSSPEKSNGSESPKEQLRTSPLPTYTSRLYPPHDPGGFLPYQNPLCPELEPGPQSSPESCPKPGSERGQTAYGVSPLMQYYDTSKPLTDQYRAARTQSSQVLCSESLPTTRNSSPAPISSSSSHQQEVGVVATHTLQKTSASVASVFPVKKRLYSEMETGSEPPLSSVYPLSPPPAHSQGASHILFSPSSDATQTKPGVPLRAPLSSNVIVSNASRKISPDVELVHERHESPVISAVYSLNECSVVKKTTASTHDRGEGQPHVMQEVVNINNMNKCDFHSLNRQDSLTAGSPEQKKGVLFKVSREIEETQQPANNINNSSVTSPPLSLDRCKTIGKPKKADTASDSGLSAASQGRCSVVQEVEASESNKAVSSDIITKKFHQSDTSNTSAAVISERLSSRTGNLHGNEMNYHRGPFSPVPPTSLAMEPLTLTGNLANLAHGVTVVDRFPSTERLLPSPFYGEKALSAQHMFRPGVSSALQTSAIPLLAQSSPAIMTMAYNQENQITPTKIAYNRSDLPSVLSNKVPNIQTSYNRSAQDLSPILPATSSSSLNASSFTRSELSSILPSKVSATLNAAYTRTVLPARVSPPVDLQSYSHAVPDLPAVLPNKVPVPPTINVPSSYSRPAPDYGLLSPKTTDSPLASKSSRKRKSKHTTSSSEVSGVTSVPTSTAFQQYVALKTPNISEPSAISLKTASVVPGSAFNFGPAHSGLGLYSDKDGYAGFLEELRTAQSNYYMAAPDTARDKLNQSSHSTDTPRQGPSSFPFLGHPPSSLPRPPTYPLPQAFMDPTTSSPPALYQQYLQRHQEELLRNGSIVLHQGLLGASAAYPAGYHPALGIRQPFDALNRHSWL